MSDKDEAKANVQCGSFLSLLAIAFIVLKLTHTIDWSWWWVLAPLWMPLTFVVTIAGFVILGAVLYDYFTRTL